MLPLRLCSGCPLLRGWAHCAGCYSCFQDLRARSGSMAGRKWPYRAWRRPDRARVPSHATSLCPQQAILTQLHHVLRGLECIGRGARTLAKARSSPSSCALARAAAHAKSRASSLCRGKMRSTLMMLLPLLPCLQAQRRASQNCFLGSSSTRQGPELRRELFGCLPSCHSGPGGVWLTCC